MLIQPSGEIFIIVYGAPRTGTSLTCELVKQCGFNLGTTPFIDNKRRGYNEHPITSFGNIYAEDIERHLEQDKVRCSKVIGYPENIELIRQCGFRVKIILIHRKIERRQASAISALFSIHEKNRVKIQDTILTKRDDWLSIHRSKYEILDIHFDDLIEKKPKVLQAIVDFCESNVPIEELKKVIDPSRVKFK